MDANFWDGDLIGTAVAREREHRRVPALPLEFEWVYRRTFKCVCCGRLRPEEARREPRSCVCSYCVGEAGFVE
jgi:hypothetical protein